MPAWSSRGRYVWLLAALLGLLVLVPADRAGVPERALTLVLLTAVYAAGLAVVLADARYRVVGFVLGVPALIGAWANLLSPAAAAALVLAAGHALSVVFLTFLAAVILRAVFRRRAVTTDDVAGALCGYLLIGAAFGHAFAAVESLAPGAFRGDPAFAAGPRDPGHVYLLLTYFSFVTLTTVGYGDITPATGLTRGLATVEAVVGQFYLAVLIGDLVGKRVSQALSGQTRNRPPEAPDAGPE
jgi:hypothetical protein